jgi:hypothetical protein
VRVGQELGLGCSTKQIEEEKALLWELGLSRIGSGADDSHIVALFYALSCNTRRKNLIPVKEFRWYRERTASDTLCALCAHTEGP